MELDAVYETPSAIYIVEAKNHECDDFITRQLYYPYRYIKARNPKNKPVIPVFMKYVNGIYQLYRFRFENDEYMNSAVCETSKLYTTQSTEITLNDIDSLIDVTNEVESSCIFPQADSFARVEDMVAALYGKGEPMTVDEIITLNLDFTPRQADYYIHAAEYLDLVEIVRGTKDGKKLVKLSDKGKVIARLPYRQQKLKYAETILRSPIFSRSFRKYMERGENFTKYDIVPYIEKYRHDIGKSTPVRRAATVFKWLQWITNLIQ